MQRINYLVDSENVNDAWIKLLPQLKRKDRIIIFYTENSPHFAAESARAVTEARNRDIIWMKCFTGKNALDFQMVSRLGHYICEAPREEYVIMSNDRGFDAVVKYWMREGISISRIRGNLRVISGTLAEQERQRLEPQKAEKKMVEKEQTEKKPGQKNQAESQKGIAQPEKKRWSFTSFLKKIVSVEVEEDEGLLEEYEPSKAKTEVRTPRQSSPKKVQPIPQPSGEKIQPTQEPAREKTQTPQQPSEENAPDSQQPTEEKIQTPPQPEKEREIPVSCVLGICRSISIQKPERVHEALVALLGAEDGREVYRFLKENKEFHEKLKAIYLEERNARVINYLKVVFEYHGVQPERMEDIQRILKKHQSGSLNGMYRAMTGSFGQKKGGRYYVILKPHIRIIQKL